MATDRPSQPSFYRYPRQNNRSGWQPVWVANNLIVPWKRNKLGESVDGAGVIEVTFGIEKMKGAKVAGHDHVGVFNPDFSLYSITILPDELERHKINLQILTFYHDGQPISFEQAKIDDQFEYTNSRDIVDRMTYYPDADYYDLSSYELEVDALPEDRYNFVWQVKYHPRIIDSNGNFICVDVSRIAIARLETIIAHPGEVHSDMVKKTPPIYFTTENRSDDPMIQLYRPFADALQDVFDEQTLMRGLNWVDRIPGQLIPYLSYLIGFDLPYFQTANDKIRRSILKRGTALQKLKGSRRAIIELFEIFGFTIDLINLWSSVDGKRFIAPNENVGGGQKITTEDICQVDPVLVKYAEAGFGNLEIPLLYRNNANAITVDMWLVSNGSQLQQRLDEALQAINTNPDAFADDVCVHDVSGAIIPRKLLQVTNNLPGGIGFSHLFIKDGSVRSEYHRGQAPLGHRSVSYAWLQNVMAMIFRSKLDFDNYSAYAFVSYERTKIIVPEILTNKQANRFDVDILSKSGDEVTSSLYDFLLDFLFDIKAFHSILRKIHYPYELLDVYQTTDYCIGGQTEADPRFDAGNLQVPPPVKPFDPMTCSPESRTRGFKDADLSLRDKILAALKDEYVAWQQIIDDHKITPQDRANLSKVSKIPAAPIDPDADGYNNQGQSRVKYEDFDPDHQPDTRPIVRDLEATPVDHCYKGRVGNELTYDPVVPLSERVRCKPCNLMPGKGVYYFLQTPHGLPQKYGFFGKLQRQYGDSDLQFDDSSFVKDFIPKQALIRPDLDIQKDNLCFPGHRFIYGNRLKYNFTNPDYVAHPWDFEEPCTCEPGEWNPLNAHLIEGTDGDEYLVYNIAGQTFIGNGLDPDLLSLGDQTSTKSFTHKIYDTGGMSHPAITLESLTSTDLTTIALGTQEPIFDSARCGEDFIAGYPSEKDEFYIDLATFGAITGPNARLICAMGVPGTCFISSSSSSSSAARHWDIGFWDFGIWDG